MGSCLLLWWAFLSNWCGNGRKLRKYVRFTLSMWGRLSINKMSGRQNFLEWKKVLNDLLIQHSCVYHDRFILYAKGFLTQHNSHVCFGGNNWLAWLNCLKVIIWCKNWGREHIWHVKLCEGASLLFLMPAFKAG